MPQEPKIQLSRTQDVNRRMDDSDEADSHHAKWTGQQEKRRNDDFLDYLQLKEQARPSLHKHQIVVQVTHAVKHESETIHL